MARALKRCFWAGDDPLMVAYHDEEWGVPIHDDRRWYEKLTLDGAQAGLSWMTILRKREGYREAFRGFDAAAVARFGERDVVAPDEAPRDRAQPPEDQVGDRQRARVAGGGGRARLVRRVDLELHRRADDRRQAPRAGRHARAHGAVRRAVGGAAPARVLVRRLDDRLRVHAGGGAGQRPHPGLLPPHARSPRSARASGARIAEQ